MRSASPSASTQISREFADCDERRCGQRVLPQPAGCNAQRVADNWRPSKEQRNRPVALEPGDCASFGQLRKEAPDRIGGHPAERVADRRDEERRPFERRRFMENRDENDLGVAGQQRRREKAAREEPRER